MMFDPKTQDDSYDGLPPPDFDLDEAERQWSMDTDLEMILSFLDAVQANHDAAYNAYHALRFFERAARKGCRLPSRYQTQLRQHALMVREPLLRLFPRPADRRHAERGH